MDKFVIGDIHGAYRALIQCIERSGFDKERDMLIVMGDVVDGYPDVKKCVEELIAVRNLVLIIGNHDYWFMEWFQSDYKEKPFDWTYMGGQATLESYGFDVVPQSHKEFFEGGKYYHIEDNRVFVHGGWNTDFPLETPKDREKFKKWSLNLIWDRNLWKKAKWWEVNNPKHKLSDYDEIYIGHTSTRTKDPVRCCNVWNLDQGAGSGGYLNIVNIDTHKWWTSDCVKNLYNIL